MHGVERGREAHLGVAHVEDLGPCGEALRERGTHVADRVPRDAQRHEADEVVPVRLADAIEQAHGACTGGWGQGSPGTPNAGAPCGSRARVT